MKPKNNMKPVIFLTAQLATIAGVIYLEMSPNKYVANIMVVFKTLASLQMTAVWLTIMTFAMKLPSAATINNALELVTPEHRTTFQKFVSWLMRCALWSVTVVCLVVGQWFLFICYLGMTLGLLKVRGSAQNYLRYVKVDSANKSAIIEV